MRCSRISVVICTRNRPDALIRCLKSIAAGELQPLEILVVDQSSDDRTANALADLTRQAAAPVRHIRLDSTGQTKARNAGIKASRGDIVAFTDDDCVVDSGWLRAIQSELSHTGITCVCGRSEPARHWERPRQAMLSTLRHKKRILAHGRRNPISVGRGNNMAFRRADLVRLGGFNERIGVGTPVFAGDDLDIFCRTLQSGGVILHAPDSIILHDQPDDWEAVIRKKRGYSLSSAAVLGSRLRNGDLFAGALLAAKIFYEFGYLLCGGAIRLNRDVAIIGWNSLVGSLSGLKCACASDFHRESKRLYRLASKPCNMALKPPLKMDEQASNRGIADVPPAYSGSSDTPRA